MPVLCLCFFRPGLHLRIYIYKVASFWRGGGRAGHNDSYMEPQARQLATARFFSIFQLSHPGHERTRKREIERQMCCEGARARGLTSCMNRSSAACGREGESVRWELQHPHPPWAKRPFPLHACGHTHYINACMSFRQSVTRRVKFRQPEQRTESISRCLRRPACSRQNGCDRRRWS